MPKKKLSETRREAEEARWFEANQERLMKLFEQAEKEGALRVGGKRSASRYGGAAQAALAEGDAADSGGRSGSRAAPGGAQRLRLPDIHQDPAAGRPGSSGASTSGRA